MNVKGGGDVVQRMTLSTGLGSWLSFVEFDGEVFWTIDDPFSEW